MVYSRLQAPDTNTGKVPLDILCIQHVPFEGPAAIAVWAAGRGHTLRSVLAPELFAEESPDAAFDALVLMGGPMSANDTDILPWLSNEIAFVRRALESNRKVVGVCLGAQIVARALGAAVSRNPVKEIGWFPVTAVAAHSLLPFGPGEGHPIFHWHGETFSIPGGAVHLLRSDRCENQAFVWNDRALALQCHPEMTPAGISALVGESTSELRACGIPEDGRSLVGSEAEFLATNSLLKHLLDSFFSATNPQPA